MQTIGEELIIRQRHLPHWQAGRRTLFVTFRSRRGALPDSALELVADAIRFDHGRRYNLWLAVVMPDHVHLLLHPCEMASGQWCDLAAIMKGIKGVSARRINQLLGTSGSVWQDEYFDRLVRDETEFGNIWNYMMMNPVKAGLVKEPDEYPFFIRCEDS